MVSFKRFIVASLFGILIFSVSFPAAAQDIGNGGVGGRPAFPREDNPRSDSIFVHTLAGGETVNDGIKIINNTEETKKIAVYASDSLVSSGGAFACDQKVDTIDEVGGWIKLTKDLVTLKSAETEVVPFTITVPANADVGEHDGCVVVQEAKDVAETEGLGLSFRTAIRVAVLVPGDIIKKLEIIDLAVDQQGEFVVLTPSIRNSGNTSVDVDIMTHLWTLWGSLVSTEGNQFPVLRDQSGEWNFRHDKPFWGGWYKTNMDAAYDDNPDTFIGDEIKNETKLSADGPTVFVWPAPLAMLIEILVVLALLYVDFKIIRGYKQRRAVQKTWKTHTVKSGEDIKQLAKSRGVSWKSLAKSNRLKAPYTLEVGEKIKLPPARHQ